MFSHKFLANVTILPWFNEPYFDCHLTFIVENIKQKSDITHYVLKATT
jgi:hypothetical protein